MADRTIHGNLVLVFITATVLMGIGAEHWFDALVLAVNIYFFTFLLNLFYKLYLHEHILAKIFLSFSGMPLYMTTLLLVSAHELERTGYAVDWMIVYSSIMLGCVAGVVAWIKLSRPANP